MTGVLNLYKPKGITSSAAVVVCRKILGTKSIGHMGTLDPMGEGVLLLGVGKATRLFDYYLRKDKMYEAEFAFGYETDTLDAEGTVTKRSAHIPTQEEITAVLPQCTGHKMQVPPMYCAKSINGVRAYALARAGKRVEPAACPVEIYSLICVRQTSEHTYLFRIHCSSGTYIRSICRDLAYALSSAATMVSIKRIRCGAFTADTAIPLADLSMRGEKALINVTTAIADLPRFDLSDEYFAPLCNGIKISCDRTDEFALYCKGELFGIAHAEHGVLKVKTYLRDTDESSR